MVKDKAKKLPTLGDLEIHVLRWIWQEQPCTERTVWEHVRQDRSVGPTQRAMPGEEPATVWRSSVEVLGPGRPSRAGGMFRP